MINHVYPQFKYVIFHILICKLEIHVSYTWIMCNYYIIAWAVLLFHSPIALIITHCTDLLLNECLILNLSSSFLLRFRFMEPLVIIILGGVLPFGSIFIEM